MPAAVLVALVASPQGPEIILTERTAETEEPPGTDQPARWEDRTERQQPGGGRPAGGWEEVGLPPERVDLLGCLPRYRTVSDYCVHPFVGWVEPPVALVPDEREVADVFLVPLEFVIDPVNHLRESVWRDGREHSYYVLALSGAPYLGRDRRHPRQPRPVLARRPLGRRRPAARRRCPAPARSMPGLLQEPDHVEGVDTDVGARWRRSSWCRSTRS